MALDINNIDAYLLVMINAIFTGIGAALGSYLAQTHIIKRMDKIRKTLKNGMIIGGTQKWEQ